MSKEIVCTNCGDPIKEGDTFCMNCGHKLKSTPQSAESISHIEPTNSINSSGNNENIGFGSEPEYTSVYIEDQVQPQKPPDNLGGGALVLSILGLGFYFTSMTMLFWISLSCGIIGIIIGIISLIKKPNRGIGVVAIVLGGVNIALFMSLYLGWF